MRRDAGLSGRIRCLVDKLFAKSRAERTAYLSPLLCFVVSDEDSQKADPNIRCRLTSEPPRCLNSNDQAELKGSQLLPSFGFAADREQAALGRTLWKPLRIDVFFSG